MKELFPDYYTVLLYGPPGVGKFEYCLELVRNYLENDGRVVYLTTERSPNEIVERAIAIGVELREYSDDSFVFVDCFSWSAGTVSENEFSIDDPGNLNQVVAITEKAITRLGRPAKIIFDSLSPLFLYNPAAALTEAFQRLASKAKTSYGFLLATLQEGVHHPQVVNTLVYIVDGYIEMKFEEGDVLERKLRVHHLKGLEHDPKWRRFEITDRGLRYKDILEWV
jgi:KaiC/GvpD/RAD55 family RecA-like ATPase